MAKRLFVGSLSYDVTQLQLEELFATAGKVESATLITDKFSGNSKGFGFVEMKSGKTGGSRRKFSNSDGLILSFHKPHPGNIVKMYVLKDLKEFLIREGYLK